MKKEAHILIVIPARGGSKGVPRKNLRALNGKPLIAYAIGLANSLGYSCDVLVSSEDDEILSLSRKYGVNTWKRSDKYALDSITLDPVVFEAVTQAESCVFKREYDWVVTLQPTSPLLSKNSLEKAIGKALASKNIDTLISAVDDTHLTWRLEDGKYKPNYPGRLNRQYLPKVYKETGAFFISRRSCITPDSRLGKNIDLFLLPENEALDIDTSKDWQIAEYLLKKKRILFVVSGYREIGLGHVYNALSVAQEIMNHDLIFLVDQKSLLAKRTIASYNYTVYQQKSSNILKDIKEIGPDVVINDILDTSDTYVKGLKQMGLKVINFEDLGLGAKYADLVINAMYPEKEWLPNHYFGAKYFILREEFLLTPDNPVRKKVANVLLSFGGVDPNNLTLKTLDAISGWCEEHQVKIDVVVGPGYNQLSSLKPYAFTLHRNIGNISELMQHADIAFTSGGRTTFELASLGTPAIVLVQNSRELTHFFCTAKNGFVNLGDGTKVGSSEILATFLDLVNHYDKRQFMSKLMLSTDLKSGKKRVVEKIRNITDTI